MRNKEEQGFRKIKIVDQNFESSEQLNEIEIQSKFQLFAIFFIVFLFLVLIILLAIYLSSGNKKKKVYPRNSNSERNRNIKVKEVINNNINNYYKKDEDDIKDKNTEKYEIDQILKYVDKKVQKPEINPSQNIKISIIIMNNRKAVETKLDELYESIESQSFPDKEIIINKNDILLNSNNNISEKIMNVSTIVEYKMDTGKLMQRYDLINMVKGEYILFIQSDDTFSENVLSQIYEKASNDKLDILEYKTYHQAPPKNRIIYQPEIFSAMYFGYDNFYKLIQFHLCGKLIKREFFLNTFTKLRIAPFYFKQNIQKYDESMILLILFREAKTFESIDIPSTKKQCSRCEKDLSAPDIKVAVDLLIYMKFLMEYTEDHVPQKRMAANVFIYDFLNKRINFINKDDLILFKETLDLYLNCDKLGEEVIRRLIDAKKNVMDRLKAF